MEASGQIHAPAALPLLGFEPWTVQPIAGRDRGSSNIILYSAVLLALNFCAKLTNFLAEGSTVQFLVEGKTPTPPSPQAPSRMVRIADVLAGI
jgi:hypothetical protein